MKVAVSVGTIVRCAAVAAFAVLCTPALDGAAGSSAYAAQDAGEESAKRKARPQTKRVQAVGQWAFGRLSRAHDALAEERYADALDSLSEMEAAVDKLNDHEAAMMWQTYGFVYASKEDFEASTVAFEKALDRGGLPHSALMSTRLATAQIYLIRGEYETAIDHFEIWFDETPMPGPDPHYMIAMAYAQADDTAMALPHAEKAVALSDAPHEGRLQLLTALYYEIERFEELKPLIGELITNWPKKSYWLQLGGVYSELGEYDNALGIYEAVYEQGLFDQGREYVALAELLLHNGVPFEAASVLQEGLDVGTVQPDERTWELLASSYLTARDEEKALRPLELAARLAEDGEAFVRLGQVHLSEEDWTSARKSFAAALSKGGLNDAGLVHLLLGIANASDNRLEAALAAFEHAQKFDTSRESALQWIGHVEREMEHVQMANAVADAG